MSEQTLSSQSQFSVLCDLLRFFLDLPWYTWTITCEVLRSIVKAWRQQARKGLDNETILITGVATGIGRETAIQLAKISNKATFVFWDVNKEGLQETSDECRNLGVNIFSYVVDLTKHDDVIQTAAKVREQVGDITILFNNAGMLEFNTFLDANPVLEQKTLEVNLLSYMWTIREFLPGMVRRGKGHIVSMCSGGAFWRYRCMSAYVASKHGLKGFLDCLKLEMRIHPDKPDIKFSTIYPGMVKTNMTTNVVWEPRYKTWQYLQKLDPGYVALEVVDGILKEKEEIIIPGSIRILKYFYRVMPDKLMDRMENFVMRDIKIECSPGSVTPEISKQKITRSHP